MLRVLKLYIIGDVKEDFGFSLILDLITSFRRN